MWRCVSDRRSLVESVDLRGLRFEKGWMVLDELEVERNAGYRATGNVRETSRRSDVSSIVSYDPRLDFPASFQTHPRRVVPLYTNLLK